MGHDLAMRFRLVLAGFLTLALVAAACGDDSDADTSDETTTTTEATETTAPDTTEAEETSTTTTEPVELTASFRGVTPEVIRVGVLSYDWDRLAAIGVNFGRTTSEDIYVAALEAINDRGGVHGRMLEPYPITYLPAGTTESEAACVQHTEDHEVFVVVGVTLGDSVLCYTEVYETAAVVVGGMTEERKARAKAPYATVQNETDERSEAFVVAMDEQGLLEGRTIGVTGSKDVSEVGFNSVVAALRDAGYEVVEGLTGDNNEDLQASSRDAEIVYERFRTEGVDTTVSTTGVPLALANAIAANYESDQWLFSTLMTSRGLADAGVDPFYIDGAYGVSLSPVGTSAQPALADDPVTAACVDDIEARTGRTVPYELDVEVNDLSGALAACGFARLLEAGLTNAGPDLTNESFQAGLEAIGEIELPGGQLGFMGPGDLSAASEFLTVRFDAATGIWEVIE